MVTLEQLQEPQSLRLAMGELDANELLVAQAAVRFAYFRVARQDGLIPAKKSDQSDSRHQAENKEYVKGWNDCRKSMLAHLELEAAPRP